MAIKRKRRVVRKRRRNAAVAAPAAVSNPRRRRKRRAVRNAAPKRRRRTVRRRRLRGNKSWTTLKSIKRARQTIVNPKKKKGAISTKARYRMRSNPKKRRVSRRRRVRGNYSWSTQRSMRRARASVRNDLKRPGAKSYATRKKMRSNPRRRYHRRHGRRNPSLNGMLGTFLRVVAPTAGALYGARFLSGKIASKVPGLSSIPVQYQSPALALGLFVAGAFAASKVAPLRKYKDQILVGLGINLADKLVSAFAPADVKSMLGIGSTFYAPQGEYMQIGATPINDDLALSEYMQVGQYFDDGASGVYSDLGISQDLGDWDDRNLGGVSNRSMLAGVPSRNMLSAVPSRGFTKPVGDITSSFDDAAMSYTGMFAGGYNS